MLNVEGVYEEIIEWLDTTKFFKGVNHVNSHSGICFGLYTLVDNTLCHKGKWTMEFSKKRYNDIVFTDEEIQTSHLIRF